MALGAVEIMMEEAGAQIARKRNDATERLSVVRRRLHQQHLAGTPLRGPREVVAWLVAMQAQEFAEAKWAVAERSRARTDAEVERAFADGEILRTHVLRPTWHFVAREDIRWLLRLTAPRVHAANRFMYKQTGLDESTLARSAEALVAALAGGEPRTRPELAGALKGAGVEAEGFRLAYVLMHAELEALICSGPRRGRQHTYALLDDRAPDPDRRTREEALGELTRRYFTSRGPATVRDFTTWSGLTVADARAGLALAGEALAHDGEWISAAGRRPRPGVTGAHLIPMYDETVMGYKDLRVVFAEPPPRAGMLERPVLLEGETVGTWKRTLTTGACALEVRLFTTLDAAGAAALEQAAARFADFLELPVTLRLSASCDG